DGSHQRPDSLYFRDSRDMAAPMSRQGTLQPQKLVVTANAAHDTVINNAIQTLSSFHRNGRSARRQVDQDWYDILAGKRSHVRSTKQWLQALLHNEGRLVISRRCPARLAILKPGIRNDCKRIPPRLFGDPHSFGLLLRQGGSLSSTPVVHALGPVAHAHSLT